jgi:acyl-CoA thioesterase-2
MLRGIPAAAQPIEPERIVHSLHGYFMRSGNVRESIVYPIDRLRDGRA